MEDLFTFIANNYSDSFDGSLTQVVMDDSVARANDFFDLGGRFGLGADALSPLSFEGADFFVENPYHFEDQIFNPTSFAELGFTGQDALDLLITHEGTSTILHDLGMHFDGFQEELCSDYMTGVRAGMAGMDVSQIKSALADISQESGHADGSFRVEAFSEGVAFANEFMETHGQPPTFNDCLEDYNDGHMHDLADLARLGDQLYFQECEMVHYHGIVEDQPDNDWAQQQYQESEAKYHLIQDEFEQKQSAFWGENGSMSESTGVLSHGLPVEGEHHPTFGYKDGLYTKSEIASHKHDVQNEIDHQKSRIEHLKKELHYAGHHESEKSKISFLSSSLSDAERKLSAAQAKLSAWENTKPKREG